MHYTTSEVIAWLETRDPTENYNYTDNEDCLFARFLKDMGHENVIVYPQHWGSNKGSGRVPPKVNKEACKNYTMGDALAQLKALPA